MSIYFNHLMSLIFPVTTFGFFLSGPHSVTGALAWTVPFWLVLILDWKGPKYIERPADKLFADAGSSHFYDGIVFGLAGFQFINIGLMLQTVSALPWDSQSAVFTSLMNLVVIRFLVGTSSGTSGVVVSHELIHRPQPYLQLLGRAVLCTLCYEHFTLAHKRGHHLTISLPEDITTARFGESFAQYWRRVYIGHLAYVWQLELERIKYDESSNKAVTLLKNQVLQGLLIEIGLVLLMIVVFGWLAAAFFVYQAFVAVRIIEAINYVQHWGLQNGYFGNSYGWVCDSWITKYSLISLSHHIGHHLDETRPYYAIPYSDQGPKMPYGYFVMNLWAKIHNASYQKMAAQELKRFRARQVSEL